MGRFVIEHLPRAAAAYEVIPMNFDEAKLWLEEAHAVSIIRTSEMIAAIDAGMGVALLESPDAVSLRPGDEALLITLSFGVLLAWAEGKITPLREDWRCILLMVQTPGEVLVPVLEAAIGEDVPSDELLSDGSAGKT